MYLLETHIFLTEPSSRLKLSPSGEDTGFEKSESCIKIWPNLNFCQLGIDPKMYDFVYLKISQLPNEDDEHYEIVHTFREFTLNMLKISQKFHQSSIFCQIQCLKIVSLVSRDFSLHFCNLQTLKILFPWSIRWVNKENASMLVMDLKNVSVQVGVVSLSFGYTSGFNSF